MSIVGGCLALAQKRVGATILRFCAGWYIIDCLIIFFGPSLIGDEALRFLVSLGAKDAGVISLIFAVLFSVAAFCASSGVEEAEKKAKSALQASQTKTYEPIIGVETDALIKRGNIFLEENNFEQADIYFEQALNQSPENSQAYLGKLMTELKVHNTDELIRTATPLKEHKLFQRALTFANNEEKTQLEGYVEAQEHAEIEKKYVNALEMKRKIRISSEVQPVVNAFKSIAPYKDSEAILQELKEMEKEFSRKAGNRSTIAFFIIVAVIAGIYAYDWYEQKAKERAEQARIEAQRAKLEAEKNEEKSRIEALKLQFQGQN